MSNYSVISYVVTNCVATIGLNRPETRNAMSKQLRQEMLCAIQRAETDDHVRIIVVRGEGEGFSSGTDLTEGTAGYQTASEMIHAEYKPILMAIEQSSKIYIASVHGCCAGISAALMMVCDLAIMSECAYLYIPFASLSLIPDGGLSYFLVRAIGYRRACQLYLESGRLSSEECLNYGVVNRVVGLDVIREETQQWGECLAEGPPLAQKFAKRAMRRADVSSLEESISIEAEYQNCCVSSKDFQRGIEAFFSKQKPFFQGE